MLKHAENLADRAQRPDATYVERAVGGLARVVRHEIGSASGHYAELRERFAVARRARGLGELVRFQLDLLPETRARLRHDQSVRLELLRDWARGLRGRRSAA